MADMSPACCSLSLALDCMNAVNFKFWVPPIWQNPRLTSHNLLRWQAVSPRGPEKDPEPHLLVASRILDLVCPSLYLLADQLKVGLAVSKMSFSPGLICGPAFVVWHSSGLS